MRQIVLLSVLALGPAAALANYEAQRERNFNNAISWANPANASKIVGVVAGLSKRPAGALSATPSPVKYLWVVRDTKDGSVLVVNDAGNLVLQPNGSVIDLASRQVVVGSDTISKIRAEVLKGISPELTLNYKMGNGEGRNVVLWTAVDCPSCVVLERGMDSYTRGMNGIIRIVPTSLAPTHETTLSQIWCSENPASAWEKWMKEAKVVNSNKKVGGAGCEKAAKMGDDLGVVLRSAGFPVFGTPSFIYENGLVNSHILKTAGVRGDNLYGLANSDILRIGLVVNGANQSGWVSHNRLKLTK